MYQQPVDYPQQPVGFPPQPVGFPPQQSYPPQQGYPQQPVGFPPQQGYPQQQGFGFGRFFTLLFICLIFCLVVLSKNGKLSEWSEWSTCDKTCGDGTQTRTRTYIPPVYLGSDLQDKDKLKETQKCNQGPCITSPNAPSPTSSGGSDSGGSNASGSNASGSNASGSNASGSNASGSNASVSALTNWAGFEYTSNNECGPFKNNKACPSGQCCSILGFCGSTDAHCKQMGTSAAGGFGSIHNGLYNDTRPSYNSADLNNINWAGFEYTTNNDCGPFKNNKACPNDQCCSTVGFCGNSDAHCKQMGTDAAGGSGSLSRGLYNSTKPSYYGTTPVVTNWAGFEYSTDGKCALMSDNYNYKACPNGQCCSNAGWCGSTDQYCNQYSRGHFNTYKPSNWT